MIYDIGDKVTLTTTVKDDSGTLTNATMTIVVTKPDGTSASASAPSNVSTGVYTSTVTVDQAGTWTYVWTASGTVIAVEPGQFTVRAQTVYVASLEETKAQLNRTDSGDDLEIRVYLAAATRYVESRLGGPVSVQTFTERYWVTGDIVPRKRPLQSVTSITPDFGTALTTDAYVVDTDLNLIVLRYGMPGWNTVVYKAGQTQLSENAKLAGMMVVQHLWDTQNGFAGRRQQDDVIPTGFGFAVPRRAEELLGVSGDAISGVA